MREPNHILVLVENLSVPFDRRVWHECVTLTANGYRVSVICPRGKRHDCESFAELDGVRIYRYPPPPTAHSLAGYLLEYPAMLASTLHLAWRVWRRDRFDAIHACNPPDLFFLIGLVFRPLGVWFIYDQHDANPEILAAKRGGQTRNRIPEHVVRWAERLTYALADVVISPNESYRRLALTRGCKHADDVHVVRSGPGAGELSPAGTGRFDRHGHEYLVGYLGVMGKQDGVDLLVRAIACVVGEGRDVLLYLAGDGESFNDIRRLVARLGLSERVLMPGYQSAAEFMPALEDADVCVAPDPPSAFNNISTMNKIVEYMALGRPCVAFGLPENRVTGGDAVAYADGDSWQALAEAIRKLLDDPPERQRLAREARCRFLSALAWEQSEPELLRAYARVGAKRRRHGRRHAGERTRYGLWMHRR